MQNTYKFYSLACIILIALVRPASGQWTLVNSPTNQSLESVFMTTTTEIFIGGEATTFFRSTNSGATWSSVSTSGADDINNIRFVTNLVGYGAADNGQVIKTTDGGITWNDINTSTNVELEEVSFINVSIGWAVGEDGEITHTTNGGTSWTDQTSGTANELLSVFFTDANNGHIGGRSGVYLRTTNGGTTWTLTNLFPGNDLNDVFFTSASVGYIATESGTIFKTTNGGVNWSQQNLGTNNDFNSVFFVSLNEGYTVGQGGVIFHTTDAGATWASQSSSTGIELNDVHCADVNHCFAVGESGTIIKMEIAAGCTAPTNVTVSNILSTSATVTWDDVGANKYVVKYRPVGQQDFNKLKTNNNTATLTNLLACTTYQVKVVSKCTGEQAASPLKSFATIGCRLDNENYNAELLSTFPNPAHNYLNIVFSSESTQKGEVNIFDLQGRTLKSEKHEFVVGLNQFGYDVNDLSEGVYVIQIVTGNEVRNSRFIIE